MAVTLLTDKEYEFLTTHVKTLQEQAKDASPRAAAHLRAIVKMHSDFLAIEDGKRATSKVKTEQRQAQEQDRLQRQQARLAKLQEKMKSQPSKEAPAHGPGKSEKSA